MFPEAMLAVPAFSSTSSTQHCCKCEVSVVLTPLMPGDTRVCSPATLSPHRAGAVPSWGCREARLQADVAQQWKFLDVHHSELHSWDSSQLSHQLGLGGGQGVSGRDPSADSRPKPPSRWGGRSGTKSRQCWRARRRAAEVKLSKEEEQPAEDGGREMVGDRRLDGLPREGRHNGGKLLRGCAGGSARP